jgi:protein involved in polysaccharide export with SLBB domain
MDREDGVARFILAIVASLWLVGCGGNAPMNPALSEPVSSEALGSGYKLGVADKVRVIVYNEANLSGEFSVGANGKLSLPLIGEVDALDRTTEDVQKEVQARLADGYLVSPNVSMEILSFRPYYILGEVNKPGEYPFSVDLTVLKAVATAQGFSYRADKKRVFIKRQGETQEYEVPLSASTPVHPGDTIRVAERFF